MLSNRPYLLRAFYQWIVDSHCTPILVVNVNDPRCKVPRQYIEGEEIVFNIAPSAVRDFKILNESIEFKATFSGIIHIISAPINAVSAVYAEENGEGIFFDAEEDSNSNENSAGPNTSTNNNNMARPYRAIETQANQSIDTTSTDGPTSRGQSSSDQTIVSAKKAKPFLKLVE